MSTAVLLCHPSITAAAAEHIAHVTGRELVLSPSGNFILDSSATPAASASRVPSLTHDERGVVAGPDEPRAA